MSVKSCIDPLTKVLGEYIGLGVYEFRVQYKVFGREVYTPKV